MNLRIKALVALSLFALVAGPAAARADVVLWYNGDFNGNNGLSNERNTSVSQGNVYDNFNLSGTTTISAVFSNNLMDFVATSAYWEIRSGVSVGNGGTLLASGTGAATQTPTGRSGFGFTESTVEVSGLSVVLGPGTYWLTVSPIDSGSGRSFNSNTSGANSVGSPGGNDDNSFFDSTTFGANFQAASDFVGAPADFSMGVIGSSEAVSTPEPASLTMLGIGVAGLMGYGWRRRKVAVVAAA